MRIVVAAVLATVFAAICALALGDLFEVLSRPKRYLFGLVMLGGAVRRVL